jgi:L-seryl-tRNA(Ser) seleniumtransferase
VGGGAFPTARIPSAGLVLRPDPTAIEDRLRRAHPPIIGRIADDEVVLDLRTVVPRDDVRFADTLLTALR